MRAWRYCARASPLSRCGGPRLRPAWALLISLVATVALVAGVMAILFLVPSGIVQGIGAPILLVLLLSWFGGLFLGARFLQRTA